VSTPEPVDETPAGKVEIRGGDRDEDFMPADGAIYGLALTDEQTGCGPGCRCGEDE
jgi:hypothetical protein